LSLAEFLAFVAGVSGGASATFANPELAILVLQKIFENADIGIKRKRGKVISAIRLETTFDLSEITTVKRD
jgi:hypothetical protein